MKCATVVRAKRSNKDNADGSTEHCKFHVSAAMVEGFAGVVGILHRAFSLSELMGCAISHFDIY